MNISDRILLMKAIKTVHEPFDRTAAFKYGLIKTNGTRTSKVPINESEDLSISPLNQVLWEIKRCFDPINPATFLEVVGYMAVLHVIIESMVSDADEFMDRFISNVVSHRSNILKESSTTATIKLGEIADHLELIGFQESRVGPFLVVYDDVLRSCIVIEEDGGDGGPPTNNVGDGQIAGTTPDTVPGPKAVLFGRPLRRNKKKKLSDLVQGDNNVSDTSKNH